MKITKQNIGDAVYFIDRIIGNEAVMEFGEIFSIIPKYNFQDQYSNGYSREENIMISVRTRLGNAFKVVSNSDLIFMTMEEAHQYCDATNVVYGYSVLEKKNDA